MTPTEREHYIRRINDIDSRISAYKLNDPTPMWITHDVLKILKYLLAEVRKEDDVPRI